jgi:hypothetical protein
MFRLNSKDRSDTRISHSCVVLRLPVQQRYNDADSVPCVMTSLDTTGATLEQCGARLTEARFVWLDFVLPNDSAKTIRALGEVQGRDRDRDACVVRFKHLFPDYRRSLESFLQSQAATPAAA